MAPQYIQVAGLVQVADVYVWMWLVIALEESKKAPAATKNITKIVQNSDFFIVGLLYVNMERERGIEPPSLGRKHRILPLNYSRI